MLLVSLFNRNIHTYSQKHVYFNFENVCPVQVASDVFCIKRQFFKYKTVLLVLFKVNWELYLLEITRNLPLKLLKRQNTTKGWSRLNGFAATLQNANAFRTNVGSNYNFSEIQCNYIGLSKLYRPQWAGLDWITVGGLHIMSECWLYISEGLVISLVFTRDFGVSKAQPVFLDFFGTFKGEQFLFKGKLSLHNHLRGTCSVGDGPTWSRIDSRRLRQMRYACDNLGLNSYKLVSAASS